jgi:hypothetical protein
MNVSDKGLRPDENLCIFLPTIYSGNIGLDGVCSYRFITSSYIDHRIGRLKTFAKDGIERHPCILSGDLESLLDDVGLGARQNEDEVHRNHAVPPISCVVHGDVDEYLRQGLHLHCIHSDGH